MDGKKFWVDLSPATHGAEVTAAKYNAICVRDQDGPPRCDLPSTFPTFTHSCKKNDCRFYTSEGGCKYIPNGIVFSMRKPYTPNFTSNWQNANDYCLNLQESGYTDWSLPSQSELSIAGIKDARSYFGFDVVLADFWSSTPGSTTNTYRTVSLDGSGWREQNKDTQNSIVCVRRGTISTPPKFELRSIYYSNNNVQIYYDKDFSNCAVLKDSQGNVINSTDFCTNMKKIFTVPASNFAVIKPGMKVRLCDGNNPQNCTPFIKVSPNIEAYHFCRTTDAKFATKDGGCTHLFNSHKAWSRTEPATLNEAKVLCENLAVRGTGVVYDDWRLPTQDELLTASTSGGAKNHFDFNTDQFFWADAPLNFGNAQVVNLADGATASVSPDFEFNVTCVRDGAGCTNTCKLAQFNCCNGGIFACPNNGAKTCTEDGRPGCLVNGQSDYNIGFCSSSGSPAGACLSIDSIPYPSTNQAKPFTVGHGPYIDNLKKIYFPSGHINVLPQTYDDHINIIEYDPISNQYQLKASLNISPNSINFDNVIYVESLKKLYLIGGLVRNISTQALSVNEDIYEYDFTNQALQKLASPKLRVIGSSAVWNSKTNKIYVFAGELLPANSVIKRIAEFDPIAKTVNLSFAEFETPRTYTKAVFNEYAGKSYIFGGTNYVSPLEEEYQIIEFDPLSATNKVKKIRSKVIR